MADRFNLSRAKESSVDGDGPRTRWLEANQHAIASYNKRVAEHGLLSDDVELLKDQEKGWIEENRAAIESINSFIDQYGLLAPKLR